MLKFFNNSKKKFFLVLAALLSFSSVISAKEAIFTSDEYDIKLYYNSEANPGDAIFVRLKFTNNNKKVKSTKEQMNLTTAKLELFLNNKLLDKSDFYVLPDYSTKNTVTMLTGLPLSSWWTKDDYSLKVTYKLYDSQECEFNLPFEIINKTFISETLQLDDNNTQIKTNTSPTRLAQIDKLNNILAQKNTADIYQLNPYVSPTKITRRTSNFADRRVYAYTNGKSSTSLHYGTDYGCPEGSSVTACAQGKVVMAENRISTGWSVVIEHLPGLYSLYYHMSELKVKEGDMVKEGELIGLSGSTGLATGPHLHWEMRLNMCAVNPDFFTQDFTFSTISK